MELQFLISCEDIFSQRGDCVVLLENWISPSRYLTDILQHHEIFTTSGVIEEFIQVYKRKSGPDVLGINIGQLNELDSYFYKISLAICKAAENYGTKIHVFLARTSNSRMFMQSAINYCEKNLKTRLKVTFFCEESQFAELEALYLPLKKKIKSNKKLLTKHLFSSFICTRCNNFAYKPTLLSCCQIILCENCSKSISCFKCSSTKVQERERAILRNLLGTSPYFCSCGEQIAYMHKQEHDKICTTAKYRCKLCSVIITYKEIADHLESYHLDTFINEKIFN